MISTVIGALAIGLIIGLLGSGGSVVTVPVLVYVVGHSPKAAISESLAIVGIISLVAAIPYAWKRRVDWASVFWFGLPGIGGTIVGAWLGGHAADAMQLGVLALVLLVTAAFMIRGIVVNRPVDPDAASEAETVAGSKSHRGFFGQAKKMVEGSAVGILTGFVGVGGGFMIVPALAILGGLSMQMAIGTSLVIIFLKSAAGFAKYQQQMLDSDISIDMYTIALFAGLGIVTSLMGQQINSRLNQRILNLVFTIFLVITGSFVLVRESSRMFQGSDNANKADVGAVK